MSKSRVTSEVLDKYNSGVPVKDLLLEYGISKTQFYRRLKKEETTIRGYTRFTYALWQTIGEEYKNGLSLNELAEKYNSCGMTISKGLKKLGIAIRTTSEATRTYNDQQVQQAINNYLAGQPAHLAGAFCNASEPTVLRWLRDNKQSARQQINYGGDQDFFLNLDTEKACYWFGFLCADGSITKKRYVCVLLSSKDINHLRLFQQHVNYTKPIKVFKKIRHWKCRQPKEYEYARTLIGSSKMAACLMDHGFHRIKAGDWQPLEKLNDNQFRAFVAGYFDGDGSIYFVNTTGNWVWYICAKYPNFLKYLGDRIGIAQPVVLKSAKKDWIWRLVHGGNLIVPKFCRWIYQNSTVHLERKFNLAKLATPDLY